MEAADAAVKAANVRLADWQRVGGGKVNVIFRGDVAAVTASLDAGAASASKVGSVEGQTVIPRHAEKLSPKFPIDIKKTKK